MFCRKRPAQPDFFDTLKVARSGHLKQVDPGSHQAAGVY